MQDHLEPLVLEAVDLPWLNVLIRANPALGSLLREEGDKLKSRVLEFTAFLQGAGPWPKEAPPCAIQIVNMHEPVEALGGFRMPSNVSPTPWVDRTNTTAPPASYEPPPPWVEPRREGPVDVLPFRVPRDARAHNYGAKPAFEPSVIRVWEDKIMMFLATQRNGSAMGIDILAGLGVKSQDAGFQEALASLALQKRVRRTGEGRQARYHAVV